MKFTNFALLALSLLSFDLTLANRCGKINGKSCPSGLCCSEFGFCGKTSTYCGAGCQSEFGTCNSVEKKDAPVHTYRAATRILPINKERIISKEGINVKPINTKKKIFCIDCVGCYDCSKNPEMARNCPRVCKKTVAI